MTLRFSSPGGETFELEPRSCLVAGWTGRDIAKVNEHIEELAELGVPRTSTTPLYYRAPAALLTQDAVIEVVGPETSGEAEPVIVDDGRQLWLGLGSDHTDRALEATSVAHAKVTCGKPVSRELWPLAELEARLDDLILRSKISEDGKQWTLYQEGSLSMILPLHELIKGAPSSGQGRLGEGCVMYCGTLPAIGGVRAACFFQASLYDPQSGKTITLEYRANVLPIIA